MTICTSQAFKTHLVNRCHCSLHKDLSSDSKVLQPQKFLMAKVGGGVLLQCRMSAGVSMSSYTMQWYRQSSEGRAVEFLTNEYDSNDSTDRFKAAIDSNNNNFSLQASNLQVSDSAIYYCAASHSVVDCQGLCTRIQVVGDCSWLGRGVAWFLMLF